MGEPWDTGSCSRLYAAGYRPSFISTNCRCGLVKVRATDSIMVAASDLDGVLAGRAPGCARARRSRSRPGNSWNFDCAALPASAIALRTASRGLGADHVRDAPHRLDPGRVEVADHVVEAEHATALDEPFLLVHAPILGAGSVSRP